MLGKVLFAVISINYIYTTNALMDIDFDSDKYPFDRQLYEDVLDPELCQRQLTYLTTDTALLARFVDAGLRVPRGIFDGNIIDFGNYHQCLGINENVDDMEISGKYCRIYVPLYQELHPPEFLDLARAKFNPSELNIDNKTLNQIKNLNRQMIALKLMRPGTNMDIRIGPDTPLGYMGFEQALCVPRPCSAEQALNELLFAQTNTRFEFGVINYRLPDDRPWVAADYVASVLFSIIGFLTVVCTSYDLYQTIYLKKGEKEINSTYISFSAYTNTRRLLTFKSSPRSLECLDGIRALAMIWVILGHSFQTISVTVNPMEVFQWGHSLQAAWVTVSPLSVDTFFFLSGLLVVYTTVGKVGRMQFLKSIHLFYLNRLLRMFPILAAVVLFESSFYLRVSDGPIWAGVGYETLGCRQFWWSTLLHVQNFVNPRHLCVGVSWYLSIDVQLHILSPIVLFWVLSSKRAAWTALNTSLLLTLTASTVYNFLNNFPSGMLSPNRGEDFERYSLYYYMNTLTRAAPFMVGMVYGYMFHLWRENNIKIPKVITTVCLLCSLLIILVVMYCSQISMRTDWDNQLADNFFNSFLRPSWALALGWIAFACIDGKAGPINWFLSLHMWKLPARISYAMYLIHIAFIMVFNSSIVAPIYFSLPSVFFNFMAYLSLTMIFAFFVTMLIDMPFSILFKLLLGGGFKKSETIDMPINENGITILNSRGVDSFTADEVVKKLEDSSRIQQYDDVKLNVREK